MPYYLHNAIWRWESQEEFDVDKAWERGKEYFKLLSEVVKHATTLAIGIIVFTGALIDKFPKPTKDVGLLAIGVGLLFGSIAWGWFLLWRIASDLDALGVVTSDN